ncbi:MAG: transglycosylase domain-containing protein [Bacteroidales bacterium]|jgi:penicillin-binding protein 1A|nr:transglycosylase domain-containing protein [Bacteroidales bacterium]
MAKKQTTKKRKNNKKWKPRPLNKKVLVWIWGLCLAIIFGIVLFFAGIELGVFGKMPTFDELENPKSMLASEVYSADGELLGKYYLENRSNVHYSELSPYLVDALIATEDVRFYQHSGIDIRSLMRAIYGMATGNSKGGASTLSQQLVKNLFPRGELNKIQLILRKCQEWVLAVKLEHYYTKEEIIAMYLNTIDFGSHAYGIKSSAWTFFKKTPAELNQEESALLIAILNAPSWYSPVRNPDRALQRRNLVIDQMEKYTYINKVVSDSLKLIPLDMSNYSIQDQNTGIAPYFREYLRQELKKWCDNNVKPDGTNYNLYKDGLKIYTTLDARMQRYAEAAVAEHLGKDLQPTFFRHWKGIDNAPFTDLNKSQVNDLYERVKKNTDRYRMMVTEEATQQQIDSAFNTPIPMKIFSWENPMIDTILSPMDSLKYYLWFLRAGLLAIEPHTGYVKAYVGGPDYRYFKYDHVKYGTRQVGSTFKPFVYTLAIQEKGYTPCTRIPKIQPSLELPDGTFWTPKNSNNDKKGEMVTLKWALANSDNWISAHLMKEMSPQSVINLAQKMGVTSELDPVPSIALGTSDITLYEMVSAFNTYPNQGIYIEPLFITRIEDKYGNVLEHFTSERHEAMSEETAYTMLRTMQGVVESGTSIRLRYKYQLLNPIAGKTGTTQNHSDGWFMGMTPYLTAGIWTGGEFRSIHFRTITYGQGANMALPIWALFMQKVYADSTINMPKDDFPLPSSGFNVNFDCEKETHDNQVIIEDF